MLACEVYISSKQIIRKYHVSLGKTYELSTLRQITPCTVLTGCFAHQSMPKSLAVNVRKQKGKFLKVSRVYVNIKCLMLYLYKIHCFLFALLRDMLMCHSFVELR